MNDSHNVLVDAYERGYRIINGLCTNPQGRTLKFRYFGEGTQYKCFLLWYNKKRKRIAYHRLVAYQLYKCDYNLPGIVVRHLDGNSHNNSENNIVLGTFKDNVNDIPKELRIQYRKQGGETKKRLNAGLRDEIVSHLKLGTSFREIISKYKISRTAIRKIKKTIN
jgi:hypothetical protein